MTPIEKLKWMHDHLEMSDKLKEAVQTLLRGEEAQWQDEDLHHKEVVDLEAVLHLAGAKFSISRNDTYGYHIELIKLINP